MVLPGGGGSSAVQRSSATWAERRRRAPVLSGRTVVLIPISDTSLSGVAGARAVDATDRGTVPLSGAGMQHAATGVLELRRLATRYEKLAIQ